MPFEEIELPLHSLTLAAKAWGPTNGRPVLALHGWMDNANSFDRLAPLLADVRLVALDMAGHGKSDHRAGHMPYYMWEYALDVLDVVDGLGWARFSLLGHSLGGGVATLVAGLVPERVDRLLLIESIGPLAGEAETMPNTLLSTRKAMQTARSLREKRAGQYRGPRFADPAEAVERRMMSPLKLPRAAIEMLVARGVVAVDGGFEWRHDPRLMLPTAVRMTEEQVQVHLARIGAPTTLILGTDGLFMDDERATFLHERKALLADLTEHVLPGSHHLHMGDSAAAIAELISNLFE